LLLAAVALSAVVALGLAIGPGYTEVSETSTSAGGSVTSVEHSSLLEHEGASVLIPLSVPIVLTGIALWRRSRRVSLVIGALGLFCCFLALLSIGIFFVLPFVLVLLAAGAQRDGPAERVSNTA
jgi:hypothetical protein